MSTNLVRLTTAVVIITFLFTSCAPLPAPGTALTDEQRSEAQRNCIARFTTVGTVGGALVGALIGGDSGRAVGAAVGAMAGGALAFTLAYGHCMSVYSDLKSFPVAGAQETAQRIGYKPTQGKVIKIEDVNVNPDGVAPGGKIKLGGTYYIMAPEGTKDVKVKETRTLEFFDTAKNEWTQLGSVDNDVIAELGTRKLDGNLDIDTQVAEGQYKLTVKVSWDGIEDSKTAQTITVRKGLAMGPSITTPSSKQEVVKTAAVPGEKGTEAADKRQTASITPKSLTVKKEPSTKSTNVATVKQGEKFVVLESKKSEGEFWHRIELKDGNSGWVQDKNVKLSK